MNVIKKLNHNPAYIYNPVGLFTVYCQLKERVRDKSELFVILLVEHNNRSDISSNALFGEKVLKDAEVNQLAKICFLKSSDNIHNLLGSILGSRCD